MSDKMPEDRRRIGDRFKETRYVDTLIKCVNCKQVAGAIVSGWCFICIEKLIHEANTRTVPPAAQPAGSPNQVPVLRRGNKTFTEVEAVEIIRDTINDWESCDLKIKAQWLLEFYDAHAAHPAPPAASGALLSSEVAKKIAAHIKGENADYYSTAEGLMELEVIISRHFAALALSRSDAASGARLTDDSCARCGGTGETQGYGDNNIMCGWCAGTGKRVEFEFPAATTSAIEAAKAAANDLYQHGCGHVMEADEIAAIITKHLNDSARPAPCADCVEAQKGAYSDATTAGFFYDKCEKHRQ